MPNAVSKPNPHADVCCDSSRHRSSAFEEKRREEGEGEEGGLWPVPRIKLNKFYVRAAYSEHARDVMGSFQGWVLP